jgi:hypothetical protein
VPLTNAGDKVPELSLRLDSVAIVSSGLYESVMIADEYPKAL